MNLMVLELWELKLGSSAATQSKVPKVLANIFRIVSILLSIVELQVSFL